jgi:multidrug resistance efflux pump
MDSLPPIPTPAAQRWREFRIQILPVLMFIALIAAIALMWKNFVQPSGVVGEVEALKANVISLQDGLVAELNVDRLQYVTNGQVIGKIIGTDPDFLKATMASAESDLKVLRARMRQDEIRTQQSLSQMRMDLWQDIELRDVAYASLTLASNMLKQSEMLANRGIESAAETAIHKAEFEKFLTEITVRTKSIQDREEELKRFEAHTVVANDPLIADAIKAKEREIEETLKPNNIRSPMDGVVTAIYRRAQERVVRGEPIVTIAATTSERIVGYIRQPVQAIPKESDTVVVRTRTQRRQVGEGQILKVGGQFEAINPGLISSDSNRVELGLPILVSLPKGMTVTPGEFVDLAIRYAK